MEIYLLIRISFSKKNLKINSQPSLWAILIGDDTFLSCLATKILSRSEAACLGTKSSSSRQGVETFLPSLLRDRQGSLNYRGHCVIGVFLKSIGIYNFS